MVTIGPKKTVVCQFCEFKHICSGERVTSHDHNNGVDFKVELGESLFDLKLNVRHIATQTGDEIEAVIKVAEIKVFEEDVKPEVCEDDFQTSGFLDNMDDPLKTDTKMESDSTCAKIQAIQANETIFSCGVCGKTCNSECQLSEHMHNHINSDPGAGESSTCDITTGPVEDYSIEKVLKTVLEKKSFKCGVCDKAFSNGYRLKE